VKNVALTTQDDVRYDVRSRVSTAFVRQEVFQCVFSHVSEEVWVSVFWRVVGHVKDRLYLVHVLHEED
jgi:hypothetical protein